MNATIENRGKGMDGDELPEGWESLELGNAITVAYGKALKAEHRRPGSFSVFGSGGQVGTHDESLISYETIVIGRKGSVGSVFHSVAPCWPIDTTYFVADFGGLVPRYLFRWLQAEDLAHLDTSSAIPGLNRDDLYSLIVPLPPLAEQRRIVAAVERILGKVSAARARLERVPTTLKRFRQAVLAAACSGRLTAGWRADDGSLHQPNEEMPEIPASWDYKVSIDIVESGTVISYGMVLPGPNLDEGVPYVRGQDITDSGKVLVDQLWRTSKGIADKHKRSVLAEGDVLLCVIRHLRVAIVPKGLDGANLTQGTVRLRPSKAVDRYFLAFFLQSPQSQEWMKARYIGMAMPRINVEHARQIPVPLPPLAEQQEIVRRVTALFARADAIEARATAALKRVESLAQAVLAKAFRGELVPTEAELARRENRPFESAADLLARVRASRETDSATPRTKPGRTRKANPPASICRPKKA
jgi:type I restriction enzyme, S subunit